MSNIKILRVKALSEMLGVSATSIWNWCNPKHRSYKANFPKPIKVSNNSTGWLEAEISEYIQALAANRDEKGGSL